MNITGLTDKGKVRDENQDAFVYGFLSDNLAYAACFDGMGGGSHVRAAASSPRTNYAASSYSSFAKPKTAAPKAAASAATAAAPLLQLAAGERVNHKTFGDGTVVSVAKMGGDALIEVNFDNGGKKKLMLKAAGVHMTKL